MIEKDRLGRRVAQGEATRVSLLTAAQRLFGSHGYAATSTEEIVATAGVTKGALYHHFSDKESLFRAVFENVEREVADAAATAFLEREPWDALTVGCRLWIEAHLDPAVRQIVLNDARAVLGWEATRAIETRFSTVLVRGGLRKAMNAGVLDRQPLRPLALMLTGALSEACLYVADADDRAAALDEVTGLVNALLSGLRLPVAAEGTLARA